MGKKNEEFLEAARNGSIMVVGKMLDQISKRGGPLSSFRRSPSINCQDMNGYTPLHHACLNGHANIVTLLLSHEEIATDVPDIRGSTPLYLAAWAGNHEIVKMLLMHPTKPANPNAQTIENDTPLHCAAQHGHNVSLAILLAHGADPAIRNNYFQTALDLAAHFGRLEAVKILIRTRLELLEPFKVENNYLKHHYTAANSKHIFTHTCLHLASRNGHKQVVETLLNAGVDVNLLTHSGTALHEAALCGKTAVVKVLVKAGVDITATDGNGRTALDLLEGLPNHLTYDIVTAINESTTNKCGESEKDVNGNIFDVQAKGNNKKDQTPINTSGNASEKSKTLAWVTDLSGNEPAKIVNPKTSKTHSSSPELPPPSATEAETTILNFMRPTHKQNEQRNHNKESLSNEEMNSDSGVTVTETIHSSHTPDLVEEFVGDSAFAGLFKGSTHALNLIGGDYGEVLPAPRYQHRLKSPSLIRSVSRTNYADEFDEIKVWEEIKTILDAMGVKDKKKDINKYNKNTETASTSMPQGTQVQLDNSLTLRKPSDLLLDGISKNMKTNYWCHSANTLVYGHVQYEAVYLGSTIIKELCGTISTRKSIHKLRRAKALVLSGNKKTPLLHVSLALSYAGVNFTDSVNQSTICSHDIRNINCVCQDVDDMRYFAYITREDDTHYCHVFKAEDSKLTTEIILTLGQAFEVAYQLSRKDS